MNEWIKCSDIPIPSEKCPVLAYNKDGDMAVIYFEDGLYSRGGWYGGCEYCCGAKDYFDYITHWQPLPEIPND